MATKTFDAKLASVRAGEPKAVHDALASTSGILIAAAIRHADPALLVPVFARMCEDGAKRDPGCRVRVAIAQAPIDADLWEPEVFERGLTVQQVEGYDRVDVLADLLADPERQAQVGAAQGMARPTRSPLPVRSRHSRRRSRSACAPRPPRIAIRRCVARSRSCCDDG